MRENTTSPGRWMAVFCSLVGGGLCCLPTSVADRFRRGLRDLAAPGQTVVARTIDGVEHQWRSRTAAREQSAERHIAELETQVAELTRQTLLWQTRSATLAGDLETLRERHPLPLAAQPTEPLLVREVLEARVLSWETEDRDQWRPVLDRGRDRGVRAEELVLASSGPVIDLGSDQQAEPDQPVIAGEAVVGRIGVVGAWTSTIQPLTSPQFRGHAQLVRESQGGAVEGATGIVTGTGTGCRLEFVPATEPVRVGDLVVTPLRQAIAKEPLVFGKVVRADLAPGAAHWEIDLLPACDVRNVSTVSVLQTVLNPRRTVATADERPADRPRRAPSRSDAR